MSYTKYLKRKNQRAERKIESLKKMIDLLRVEREQTKLDTAAITEQRDTLLKGYRSRPLCEIGTSDDTEEQDSSRENRRQFELSSLRVQNSALLARLQQAGVLKPGEQVGLYPPLTEEATKLFGRLFRVLESVIGPPEGYEENGIPLSAVVERTERKLPVIKDESNTANKLWNLILIITGSPMDTPYGPEEVAKIEDLIPEWKAKISSLPVQEKTYREWELELHNIEKEDIVRFEKQGLAGENDLYYSPGSAERNNAIASIPRLMIQVKNQMRSLNEADKNIMDLKERHYDLYRELEETKAKLSSLSEAEKSSVNAEEDIPPLVVYPDKEGHTKRGQFIASVLYETGAIAKMLIEKNQSYGNSALDPIRLFSKSDAREQIRVRIDDKLSRIQRGKEYPGDNDVNDLIGYLFLYKISLNYTFAD